MNHAGRLVVLAALASGGCSYISQGEYEELVAKLDEDGDGASSANDCDDRDPDRSNEMAEVPYDGIDNDCSLPAGTKYDPGDLDVDGDLYPALTEAEYLALEGAQLEFPPGFAGKDPDCDDGDKEVNPGQGVDVPYDGIDSDCRQDNDFDDDQDGYVASFDINDAGRPVTAQDVADYIAFYEVAPRRPIPPEVSGAWGPDGGPAEYGDCEDSRIELHPAGPGPAPDEDLPYDGKDYDCDGADDFDLDGDGHLPKNINPDEYEDYLDRYFLTDPGKPFDDCADGPDDPASPGLSLAVSATVYEGATEIWYDGIDQDCQKNNDYDQDGDTFLRDGDAALAAAYVAEWGYEGEPFAVDVFPEGDCDDEDDAFAPDQLDRLWNGIDEDCDSVPDRSAFMFDPPTDPLTWIEPANPELMFLEDRQFVLFTLATRVTVGTTQLDLAGRPIMLPADSHGPAVPASRSDILTDTWLRSNIFTLDPDTLLHHWIDLSGRDPEPVDRDGDGGADPGGWIVGGALATTGADRTNQINMASILSTVSPVLLTEDYTANIIPRQNSPVYPVSGITGLDAAPLMSATADGYRTGISVVCVPEHLHVKIADATTQVLYLTDPTTPFAADTCFFDGLPIEGDIAVIACDDGNCQRFVIDEAAHTFTLDTSLPGESWAWGDWEDGYTLLVDLAGAAYVRDDLDPTTDARWFSTESIETFDLVDAGPAGLYAVGITTDGRIVLENHHPTEGVRTADLDVVDPAFLVADPVPYGVAIEAGNGRLAIAATLRDGGGGTEGTLGWTFLGLP